MKTLTIAYDVVSTAAVGTFIAIDILGAGYLIMLLHAKEQEWRRP